MAQINEKDLNENLKRSKFEKVYLLFGDELYLVRAYKNLISKKSVTQMEEFNLHTFDSNVSIDDIMLSAQTAPLMSERSVVTVCDFKFSALSVKDSERFIEFLNDLPYFCSIVFWYDRVQFDKFKNKAFVKAIEDNGSVVELAKKNENELARIICSRAAKNGANMQPTVARYMISLCGNDLENLISQTDKLCSFTGPVAITVKDVDQIVSVSSEAYIYNLSSCIFSGNTEKALVLLKGLFDKKEDAEFILLTLASAFIDLYRIKCAETEGLQRSQIATDFKYGNRAFIIDKTANQTRSINKRTAKNAVKLLHDATIKLKNCNLDENVLLETTVLKLIRVCNQ